MIEAAANPEGAGFSWCNDTKYAVMAALGIVEMGAIVTRGWYRVEAGQCVRPDLRGDPHRLYSYAEAVDGNGRTIKRGDAPLAWGGDGCALCTRDGHFELSRPQGLRGARLNSAGFAVIDRRRQPSTDHAFQGTVTLVPASSRPAPRGFGHVETWVFDLDNTLYPHHLNLWQQVDDRIRDYVADFLKVSQDEAFRVQKDYYKRYGTTMRGLMTEHGMKPDDYLEFVHQIDHSPLEPNPALGAALEKLPGRKLILTNGTRKHADAVMRRLEIHQHFEDVFDIAAADLEPKPSPQVYERFLARHGVDAAKAAMFEDLARNLEAPHALGMTTVLVVPEGQREVFREGWELEGRDAPHVDHVTDDLTGFLADASCAR